MASADPPLAQLAVTSEPGEGERQARSGLPALTHAQEGHFNVWLPAAISALVAFAAFAVTLRGTYIYDDIVVAKWDPRLHDVHQWPLFLTTAYLPSSIDNLYRPLTSLSFAVEWWLHGDRPWAFHLVNVLLHAGATAAVATFAGRLWGRRAAWAAGLLFAVHPVHVEAVAGLVGRAESICTLATFAGLCLCLRRPITPGRIAGIFGCFVVALLAKEQGVLFPLLAALLFVLPKLQRRPLLVDPAERERFKWLGVLLLFGLAGYLIYRENILKFWWDRSRMEWGIHPMVRSTGSDRWLMPVVLVGHYLVLLVAPVHQAIDYGAMVIGSHVRYREPYFYLGVAAILGWVLVMSVAVRKRLWGVVFCLLGFALAYGMVANFPILIGTILGERLMYMPSAFFVLVLAAGWARLPMRTAGPLLAIAVVLGAARTFVYAREWNDRVSFYEANMAAQPYSTRVYELVFDEYKDRGDWKAALQVGWECQQHIPHAFESYHMIGEAAAHLGDTKTAEAMLYEAAKYTTGDHLVGLWSDIEEARAATQPAATQSHPSTEPGTTR